MIRFEWKKLWCGKGQRIIIMLTILLLPFVFYYSQSNATKVIREDYRNYAHNWGGKSPDAINVLIETEEEYLISTGQHLGATSVTLHYIKDQVEKLSSFSVVMEQMEEQAQRLKDFPIFQTDGFSTANAIQTIDDFAAVKNRILTFTNQQGFSTYLSWRYVDLFLLILLILVLGTLYFQDRELQILPLVQSCPNGGKRLNRVRFQSGLVFFAFLYVVVRLVVLISAGVLFGFGDFTAPVQALNTMSNCNLAVSIGQFIVLEFLVKFGIYIVIYCAGAFVAAKCVTQIQMFLVIGLIVVGNGALYLLFLPRSSMEILHYLNLFAFTDTSGLLGNYYNLNVMGQVVNRGVLTAGLAIVLSMAFLFLYLWFCRRLKERQMGREWKITIHLPYFSDLTLEEGRKLLVKGRGALILIVFGIALWNMASNEDFYLGTSDWVYEKLVEHSEGVVTAETESKVAEWRINMEKETDEQVKAGYRRYLAQYDAEVVRAAQESRRAYIVNELAVNELFFQEAGFFRYSAVAFLFLFILLGNLFPLERQHHMEPMLNATPKGRRVLVRKKYGWSMLLTMILLAVTFGIETVVITGELPFATWNVGLASSGVFCEAGVGGSMTFLQLRILQCAQVMIAGAVIIGIYVAISRIFKKFLTSVLIGLLIIGIFFLLLSMGINLPWFIAGAFHSVGRILTGESGWVLAADWVVLGMIWGGLHMWIKRKDGV